LGAAPATKADPVKDKYHGTEVSDPYRWLEDAKDPAVKAWSDAQNTYARAHLDRLPEAAALKARLTEILKAEVTSFSTPNWRADATS
jgi:prolyl oligopeptidase